MDHRLGCALYFAALNENIYNGSPTSVHHFTMCVWRADNASAEFTGIQSDHEEPHPHPDLV